MCKGNLNVHQIAFFMIYSINPSIKELAIKQIVA